MHRNRTQDSLEQKQYEPHGLPRCVLLKKTLVAGPTLAAVSFNSPASELSETKRAPSTQDRGAAGRGALGVVKPRPDLSLLASLGRSLPRESAGRGENDGIQTPPRLRNVNTEGRQALLLENFYPEGEFNRFG